MEKENEKLLQKSDSSRMTLSRGFRVVLAQSQHGRRRIWSLWHLQRPCHWLFNFHRHRQLLQPQVGLRLLRPSQERPPRVLQTYVEKVPSHRY